MLSTKNQFIAMLIVYIIAYIYAIEVAVFIQSCDDDICKSINKVQQSCIINIDGSDFSCLRGENYFIGDMDKEKAERLKSCPFTFWSFTHFFLYFILGIVCPSLFIPTFIIGILFEYYEYKELNCHDMLDILWNTSGFVLGYMVTKIE